MKHNSEHEADKVFLAFHDLRRETIQVYKLIVQKLNRFKISRETSFVIETNEDVKTIGYVTNDSLHLYLHGKFSEKLNIHNVSLEILININVVLARKITEKTKGLY